MFFITTLLMVVIACGLSITASAAETLPAEGLAVPDDGPGLVAGTTVYTAGSGIATLEISDVSTDGQSGTIHFTLENATIEGAECGISFGDRWNASPTTVTLIGDNTITVTGADKVGLGGTHDRSVYPRGRWRFDHQRQ